MFFMDLLKLLEDLGLEEKEAKVYLGLLKLGESTATKIAQRIDLDRTLIYQLTNKLIAKGLVSYIIKNNIKYFIPSDPKKLLEGIKEKERMVQEALPELVRLAKKQEEETRVEVYKGKKGMNTVLKDIILTKKDYLAFGEEGQFQKVLPIEVHQFMNQMIKHKIHEKVLVRADFKGKVLQTKNSELRYIPKEYLSPVTTIVYANKVASFIWTEPYHVILTENKEVADSFRSQFMALWKIAKK